MTWTNMNEASNVFCYMQCVLLLIYSQVEATKLKYFFCSHCVRHFTGHGFNRVRLLFFHEVFRSNDIIIHQHLLIKEYLK